MGSSSCWSMSHKAANEGVHHRKQAISHFCQDRVNLVQVSSLRAAQKYKRMGLSLPPCFIHSLTKCCQICAVKSQSYVHSFFGSTVKRLADYSWWNIFLYCFPLHYSCLWRCIERLCIKRPFLSMKQKQCSVLLITAFPF